MKAAGLDQSRTSLRGELIRPTDEGYAAARKVYNGMFDRKPKFIVRCADVADIIGTVSFARESGLLLAVRGGGHNEAGIFSTVVPLRTKPPYCLL